MPPIERSGRDAPHRGYWRSLAERDGSAEFHRLAEREFPLAADEMLAPPSRRGFLKLMGASMALAGMTACRWPREEILPFAARPEGWTPGEPVRFATAIDLFGAATGLVVTSYDGRPIKVEGNELHPASLGGTSALMQASLLDLYDPERSGAPFRRDAERGWADFEEFARPHFDALRRRRGEGLAILARPSSSPSLADLRERLLATCPRARWFEYEPLSRDAAREGARLAFGRPLRTHDRLAHARSILSFEEDFLLLHPSEVRLAHEWARSREPGAGGSRMHVVEAALSVTGGVADRRLAIPRSEIPAFAACVAAALLLEHGVQVPAGARGLAPELERFRFHPRYAAASEIAAHLAAHRGQSLVAAGPTEPPPVHALAHVMNAALENVGRTRAYTEDPDPDRPSHADALATLASAMDDGSVQTLLILGGNPAYDAPADLDFAARLERVGTTIHLGAYRDETAAECTWHLPLAHPFEAWGDARAEDGLVSIVQPLILPLRQGRSELELLALVLGDATAAGHDIVRRTFFAGRGAGPDAEAAWRRALHDGLVEGSARPAVSPPLVAAGWARQLEAYARPAEAREPDALELVFLADASVVDGRYANNGWLQENPDPLTKLTWDNAALLGPATAEALGVTQGDTLEVRVGERAVTLPVHVSPGQAAGTLGVGLGYGRRACGEVGRGVGVDVYPLRRRGALHAVRARVRAAGGRYALASTQEHYAIDPLGAREREDRVHSLVREVELDEFRRDPAAALHHGHTPELTQLWRAFDYDGHRWGMAIDLNACTGCGACAVACQAENNIPVVGKDEVARGREMHWIRVDRYFQGDPEAPSVVHQPVTCHHCENAPCEQVCPVAATVHDSEGLNVMVYNRCVGTRYCSNNCPYKVRRFNYFNNHKHEDPLRTMAYNPEVTVRSRGVMEKCTFCVQRINAARIRSRADGQERIPDGTIRTACEQACPTRAITFGDLNDPQSVVRRRHEDARAYGMLEEWNVRPRTRYLARVRNRGAAAADAPAGDPHGGEA